MDDFRFKVSSPDGEVPDVVEFRKTPGNGLPAEIVLDEKIAQNRMLHSARFMGIGSENRYETVRDPVVAENDVVRRHRLNIEVSARDGNAEYADIVDPGVFHQ